MERITEEKKNCCRAERLKFCYSIVFFLLYFHFQLFRNCFLRQTTIQKNIKKCETSFEHSRIRIHLLFFEEWNVNIVKKKKKKNLFVPFHLWIFGFKSYLTNPLIGSQLPKNEPHNPRKRIDRYYETTSTNHRKKVAVSESVYSLRLFMSVVSLIVILYRVISHWTSHR